MIADAHVELLRLTPNEATALTVLQDQVLDFYQHPEVVGDINCPFHLMWHGQFINEDAWRLVESIRRPRFLLWAGAEFVKECERKLRESDLANGVPKKERIAFAPILLRAIWWHGRSVSQLVAYAERWRSRLTPERENDRPRVRTYAKSGPHWFCIGERERTAIDFCKYALWCGTGFGKQNHRIPPMMDRAVLYSIVDGYNYDKIRRSEWHAGRDWSHHIHLPSVGTGVWRKK